MMKLEGANWIHLCLTMVTITVILELSTSETFTIQQNLFTNLNEITFVGRALSECAIACSSIDVCSGFVVDENDECELVLYQLMEVVCDGVYSFRPCFKKQVSVNTF